MKSKATSGLIIACVFIWIGFILTISFIEAALIYRVPGITLCLQTTFGSIAVELFNKVEWLFALGILSPFLFWQAKNIAIEGVVFLVVLLILMVQTAWLLPQLEIQTEMYTQSKPIPASNHHLFYVVGDILKVLCLTIVGVRQVIK